MVHNLLALWMPERLAALPDELNDRWNFYGNTKDFKSTADRNSVFCRKSGSTVASDCQRRHVMLRRLALDGGVAGGPPHSFSI